VGIMGKSGSGKTTLLKTIAGIDKNFSGQIFKHTQNEDSDFHRAYLPQTTTAVPLFSVKQHLQQRLDFLQIRQNKEETISSALKMVELEEFADNIVAKSDGRSWQISGGQQKRLGIAIEMLANPEVLVLDEPTSGLSSTDSLNIVSLLRKIARQQKIVIASIHQPDYETFMLFDKIILIDEGGYPIFYGSPTESAEYFRKVADKIDLESLLETHFNPGVLLNIIGETKTTENGGTERKIPAEKWYNLFKNNYAVPPKANIKSATKSKENPLLSFWNQLKFTTLCEIKNKWRLFILLLIPPITSLAMSLISRHSLSESYSYFSNPNVPAWLMMLLISAFFFGLVISGHEFIFLRQFHKNEHIISRRAISLALAKATKYLIVSLVFATLLVVPAVFVIGCKFLCGKLLIACWMLVLCGNLLSLILSVFFKNVSTIYLLAPIIIILQMIFSGGLVQFDNFNQNFTNKEGKPYLADIMPIRWADEACMTAAFYENPIEMEIYPYKVKYYELCTAKNQENNIQNINQEKKIIQHQIDSILTKHKSCDETYKTYSNMFITKIVSTPS
ncbi:MAG: ATP-binding cassette domain-containing protein, partial [Bacteroidales bacterium]|nr:ATP-binding cassette domain-containing protein [Bacteroidales bacterium]